MNEDITTLLDRAAPTAVAALDLDRAQREGRTRARRVTTTVAATSAVVVASAVVVVAGWLNESGLRVDPAQSTTDVTAHQAAAGCRPVPIGDPEDVDHYDPRTAPRAEDLYDVPLPSAGPHLAALVDVRNGIPETPLDVRAVVHNLEHGAIVIWLDANQLAPETIRDVGTWADTRRAQGFAQDQTGANLIVSPTAPDADVAAVSLRAWGVALDCSEWSSVVADQFMASNYGTRGVAPERSFGPYPSPDPLG